MFNRNYITVQFANVDLVCGLPVRTAAPSPVPNKQPTLTPTPVPSNKPSPSPTTGPSVAPTPRPTHDPTPHPTTSYAYTDEPTPEPPLYENTDDDGGGILLAPKVDFNEENSILRAVFSHDDFHKYGCKRIALPSSFGYKERFTADNFNLDVDFNALTTALAINLGILSTSFLEQIGLPPFNVTYKGVTYEVIQYYDKRIPQMTPITCINRVAGRDPTSKTNFKILCLLKISNVFTLPVFNHFGAQGDYYDGTAPPPPAYCSCTGVGKSATYCSVFDLLPALIFYNAAENSTSDILDLYSKYTMQEISRLAHNISYSVVGYYRNEDVAYQKQIWSFCGGCSIVVINLWDEQNRAVSQYFHEIFVGSCANTFYFPSVWGSLKSQNNPPTLLVAIYYSWLVS